MSCLLGICDSKVSPNYTQSPYTNKIGGIPNWPVNVKVSTPSCQVCGELQNLVVQLYCCLEKSAYHRTLYVFACSNPTCWNHQQSWTVYRCQSLDSNTQNPVNSSSKHNHIDNIAADSGKVADDWGVGADDWGNGADDWGNDADDWGNGDCDISTSANVTSNLANSSDFAAGNKERSTQDNGDFKQCSSLDGGCLDIKQLCIDDVTDEDVTDDDVTDDITDHVTCGNGGEKPDSASHVLSEDMPSLSEQEKSNFLNTCQASSSRVNVDDKVLESYFINVFEEPSSQADDNYHVAKLLKDYQKREGCNVKDLMEGVSSEGGGKSEQYEKTSLLHRDFMFHKFMKRLSLCPEQCIRYQWNGSALFNSSPTSKLPNACCHCGGEVVFELQLTPALINHLKFPHQTESVIEFGTVLVYTCKQSCWDETVSYRIEHVLVQPDPDHHLFKKNQN